MDNSSVLETSMANPISTMSIYVWELALLQFVVVLKERSVDTGLILGQQIQTFYTVVLATKID